MFWDGEKWVGAIPPPRPAGAPRRLRDWLATIPIVLLVPALVLPLFAVDAAPAAPGDGGATLDVRGSTAPGSSVRLVGSGFAPEASAAAVWDGNEELTRFAVNSKGGFNARAVIPVGASAGPHAIAVAYGDGSGGAVHTSIIEVVSQQSEGTPAPIDTPVPATTPTPTAPVTPAPTATPAPTGTPIPTASATTAPTATPAPTPAPTATPARTPAPTPAPTATPAPTPALTAAPTPTAAPTASPTAPPSPTPSPTPIPRPTATPAPTPTPASADPFSVPFLSRTPSAAIRLTAPCDNVTISGKQFVSLSSVAIVVEGCRNVTITGNDFSGVVGGVFALNSSNVVVTYNRFQNIGNGTIGSGRSNLVQFNTVAGGRIANNKGVGGRTEDMISIYKSGGSSAASLVIENNALEGTTWSSSSGTGIIIGDGGSSGYVVVRNNTLLTPGQVGIQLIDGPNHRVYGNVIYAAPRPGQTSPNVGMSSWAGNPTAEVYGNEVRWYRNDGSQNPYWWGYGTIDAHDNNWNAVIDPSSLKVTL